MSQYFQIHPQNPQARLIRQSVEVLRNGGLIVYPTDSMYAFGCQIGDKSALERLRRIRKLDANYNFSLVCRDLSEISTFARVENSVFRLLKAITPGPYTFILTASKEVPRRLLHPKRKTIGIRVPDHAIAQALLQELGEPMLSATFALPNQAEPIGDPEEIRDVVGHEVDLVIDGQGCGYEPTTIVDLTEGYPQVIREGKGDTKIFENN